MTNKRVDYILIPPDTEGYPYGLSCECPFGTELHGPFGSYREALDYKAELLNEYSDYGEIKVVKIETPQVSS